MKQLKTFLTKIRPTVPLTEAPLVRPKGLTKGRERLVLSMFSTKILLPFTPAIFYTHLLYPHIIFLAYKYFSLHIHWPIIHVIFSFGRIIIDIIVYGSKRKTCINVSLFFSIHILSFAHTLTHNSHHFFLLEG